MFRQAQHYPRAQVTLSLSKGWRAMKRFLEHFKTPSKQPSVKERIAAGIALRDKFPCSKQGDYNPAA